MVKFFLRKTKYVMILAWEDAIQLVLEAILALHALEVIYQLHRLVLRPVEMVLKLLIKPVMIIILLQEMDAPILVQ